MILQVALVWSMTLAWLAQRLRMGSWGYVSNLVKGTVKSANI
jgi:hypothetical protein